MQCRPCHYSMLLSALVMLILPAATDFSIVHSDSNASFAEILAPVKPAVLNSIAKGESAMDSLNAEHRQNRDFHLDRADFGLLQIDSIHIPKVIRLGVIQSIDTLINQARHLLQREGKENFSIGNLLQTNATPWGMSVGGIPSSGTATLYNVWGGTVMLLPLPGTNTGFTLTYEQIPRDDCIQLAALIGQFQLANAITINKTHYDDGKVSAWSARMICKFNHGNAGSNTMIFTMNN